MFIPMMPDRSLPKPTPSMSYFSTPSLGSDSLWEYLSQGLQHLVL